MGIVYNPKAGRPGRDRQMDYQAAFQYWLECGTLKKAAQAMERDGYRIVRKDGTISPFSFWTVRRGAWIWVIENPDEALKIWQDHGYFPNGKDEQWKHFVARKIRTHMPPKKGNMEKALRLNGIYEWYKENYEPNLAGEL